MKILTANYVLPITTAPIENGAIAIDGDIISAVGPANEIVREFPNVEITDLGESAILPGFVNCHSHLEITGMRGALDEVEDDFRSWLLRLNDTRAEMSEQNISDAAVLGAVEGVHAGVTCFGVIGRNGIAGFEALKTVGLRGTVYLETEFSPDNRTAEKDFSELAEKYEKLRFAETDLVKVGLSPHSPYTVGSHLFELIAQYAILNRIPLSIHASESAHEQELLTNGSGFFRELYDKFEFEWESPHCTPIEYLERLGVLSAQPLLAHCVNVSADDIAKIASTGSKIAHCPKSNLKFAHGIAPLELFLDAGIAVGLGSDSVASNNICDLIEEARFAALVARTRDDSVRFLAAEEMLKIATIGGAEALALDSEIGSLEKGKQADIIAISLGNKAQQPINEIHAAIVFASNARDVTLTMVAGKTLYSTF
jgi:5-methylthioadenosine/S-adenosylhomocysteine deaminase